VYKGKIRNNLVKYMKEVNKSFPQTFLLTAKERTVVQNSYRELVVSEIRARVNFEASILQQLLNTLQVLQLNTAMFCGENSNMA